MPVPVTSSILKVVKPEDIETAKIAKMVEEGKTTWREATITKAGMIAQTVKKPIRTAYGTVHPSGVVTEQPSTLPPPPTPPEEPTPTIEQAAETVESLEERLGELETAYKEETRHAFKGERYQEYRQFYETQYLPAYQQYESLYEAEQERRWESFAAQLKRAGLSESQISAAKASWRYIRKKLGKTPSQRAEEWESYLTQWTPLIVRERGEKPVTGMFTGLGASLQAEVEIARMQRVIEAEWGRQPALRSPFGDIPLQYSAVETGRYVHTEIPSDVSQAFESWAKGKRKEFKVLSYQPPTGISAPPDLARAAEQKAHSSFASALNVALGMSKSDAGQFLREAWRSPKEVESGMRARVAEYPEWDWRMGVPLMTGRRTGWKMEMKTIGPFSFPAPTVQHEEFETPLPATTVGARDVLEAAEAQANEFLAYGETAWYKVKKSPLGQIPIFGEIATGFVRGGESIVAPVAELAGRHMVQPWERAGGLWEAPGGWKGVSIARPTPLEFGGELLFWYGAFGAAMKAPSLTWKAGAKGMGGLTRVYAKGAQRAFVGLRRLGAGPSKFVSQVGRLKPTRLLVGPEYAGERALASWRTFGVAMKEATKEVIIGEKVTELMEHGWVTYHRRGLISPFVEPFEIVVRKATPAIKPSELRAVGLPARAAKIGHILTPEEELVHVPTTSYFLPRARVELYGEKGSALAYMRELVPSEGAILVRHGDIPQIWASLDLQIHQVLKPFTTPVKVTEWKTVPGIKKPQSFVKTVVPEAEVVSIHARTVMPTGWGIRETEVTRWLRPLEIGGPSTRGWAQAAMFKGKGLQTSTLAEYTKKYLAWKAKQPPRDLLGGMSWYPTQRLLEKTAVKELSLFSRPQIYFPAITPAIGRVPVAVIGAGVATGIGARARQKQISQLIPSTIQRPAQMQQFAQVPALGLSSVLGAVQAQISQATQAQKLAQIQALDSIPITEPIPEITAPPRPPFRGLVPPVLPFAEGRRRRRRFPIRGKEPGWWRYWLRKHQLGDPLKVFFGIKLGKRPPKAVSVWQERVPRGTRTPARRVQEVMVPVEEKIKQSVKRASSPFGPTRRKRKRVKVFG